MSHMIDLVDSSATPVTPSAVQQTGLTAGTMVLTLAGALPVEHLTAGDRIITRDGARPLKAIHARIEATAQMICISASAIGVEQPEDDMLVTPDSQILIRDWRAKALKGCDQAVMAAANLVDGEYIRHETTVAQRIFSLEFDTAVVIYASGVELAISPAAAFA